MSAQPENACSDTLPDGALPGAPPDALSAIPSDAQSLVTLARDRLARELDSLPPWESPLLRARLLAASIAENGVSHGALVHFIRRARAHGDAALAHELFAILLQRTEGLNRRWANRTLASAGYNAASAHDASDELRQELALRLWEHIAHGRHDAWELFFQRALTFEQRRIGARFLERSQRVRHAQQVGQQATPASHTEAWASWERMLQIVPTPTIADLADHRDAFAAANLVDLRAYVARLPTRERQATLLRFWCGASEDEIAHALGGVTTRTVRNLLTRAYARLRRLYAPGADADGAEQPTQGSQRLTQSRKGGHHAYPTE